MGNPIKSYDFTDVPFLVWAGLVKVVTIDATCVDARSTGQTHILKPGLPLAYDSAALGWVQYQPAGSNGTDTGDYILLVEVDLKDDDPTASATDHKAPVLVIGTVVGTQIPLLDANLVTDMSKAGGGLGWVEFV